MFSYCSGKHQCWAVDWYLSGDRFACGVNGHKEGIEMVGRGADVGWQGKQQST